MDHPRLPYNGGAYTKFSHCEYWDAVAQRPVAAGAQVRVVGIDRLKLTVEPVA